MKEGKILVAFYREGGKKGLIWEYSHQPQEGRLKHKKANYVKNVSSILIVSLRQY